MKEKIDKFSKGIFEYETPKLVLSTERLALSVEEGAGLDGSFLVGNSAGSRMKGLLYVTGRMLTLSVTKFVGVSCEIAYHVNALFCEAGEKYSGEIHIVSDCGELTVPFSIEVLAACLKSSVGPIRNLFHFTSLAQTNWQEAAQLFVSPEFERAVLRHEPRCRTAYRELVKSPSGERAMEEFLILLRKKKRCELSASVQELSLTVGQKDDFLETLLLTKRGWGFLEVKASVDAPYLKLTRETLSQEDFIGGQAELGVAVQSSRIAPGVHTARLVLETAHQTIRIPIVCRRLQDEEERILRERSLHRYEERILRQYLDFRNGKIGNGAFLAESAKLTEAVLRLLDRECSELLPGQQRREQMLLCREQYELYRLYLSIVDGKNRTNEELYRHFISKKAEYERTNSVCYCAVLYLEALRTRDRAMVAEHAARIRERFEQEPGQPMLFWFLLYMEKRLEENRSLRFDSIREQCERGSNTPLLYYEAAELWRSDASLVTSLGGFELRVMRYLVKYGRVTKETALQFAYLSEKGKGHHRLVLQLLIKLYEAYPQRDILEALCNRIVRMDLRRPRYHVYLRHGVREQIKCEHLYEYYLYTMEDGTPPEIDQQVLLYFTYSNTLSEEETSRIYAYVVKEKDSNPAIYRAYLKKMEQFAVNRMKANTMSRPLAVLYADVLRKSIIDREMAQTLPDLIFTYCVECANPKMTRVCVVHKEEQEAATAPIVDGRAFVPIYTEDAEVFVIDGEGNRFVLSGQDKLYRLMHGEDLLDACYEIGSDNRKLLLHIWEKNRKYNKYEETKLDLQKQVSQLAGLAAAVVNDCTLALVNYYYENYEGELLETYLEELDLHLLSAKDRERMVERMVARDMYDKVMEAFREFGLGEPGAKRLLKLCLRGIRTRRTEDGEQLLSLAFSLFQSGHVEDRLVQYLAEEYNGTTGEMYEVWNAAKERGLDTMALEERLLGQMLFTETCMERSYAVFISYCHNGMNRKLIRAYLSYCSYRFFVRGCRTNPELFEILKKEPFLENSPISVLALLKYYAGKEELTEAEKSFCSFYLQKFEQKKQIFSFFRDFTGKIPLPACMLDKRYIEYRTDPRKKVTLHYTYREGGGFQTEPMEDIGYGIFTKEVILFFGEELRYFVTVEDAGNVETTGERVVQYEETESRGGNSRYERINEILMVKERREEKTLLELLERYEKEEYAMQRHFSPL